MDFKKHLLGEAHTGDTLDWKGLVDDIKKSKKTSLDYDGVLDFVLAYVKDVGDAEKMVDSSTFIKELEQALKKANVKVTIKV